MSVCTGQVLICFCILTRATFKGFKIRRLSLQIYDSNIGMNTEGSIECKSSFLIISPQSLGI